MKVQKLAVIAISVLFFSFSSGCSMFENKPSESDIIKTLAENLPGYMEVSDIKIQAMENMGSKVEPKYHSRYVAKIKLLKPTYEKVDHIGGNVGSDVVRLVLAESTSFEAFGKAISVLDRDKWSTRITSFDFAIENRGELLGKFTRPVIEDSNDHEDALKKLKEWQQAKAEKLSKLSKGLAGKWVGNYICGQGISGLTLKITTSSTSINAVFDFYPVSQNPKAKSGSYSLIGQFTEDGHFELRPKSWIKRPKGYGMVGMSGKINDNFNKLEGSITSKHCSKFELHKE